MGLAGYSVPQGNKNTVIQRDVYNFSLKLGGTLRILVVEEGAVIVIEIQVRRFRVG